MMESTQAMSAISKKTGYIGGFSYSAFAIAFFVFYLFVLLKDPLAIAAFKNLAFALLLVTASSVVVSLFMASQAFGIKGVKILIVIAVALVAISLFLLFFERGVRYISIIPTLIDTSGKAFKLARVRQIFVAMLAAYFLGVFAAHIWCSIHRKIANTTGVYLFRSGGLLIFLGSILLIVGVGIILCEAGYIMCAIAFFRLKT